MLKKAFLLWSKIAGMMFLILFVEFILFETFTKYATSMKEVNFVFIAFFVFTIVISVFVLGFYFKMYKIVNINGFKDYLKLYFSILWRALVIVIPLVGIIAFLFKGSLFSRFLTILVEILAGFPAIFWYLKSNR